MLHEIKQSVCLQHRRAWRKPWALGTTLKQSWTGSRIETQTATCANRSCLWIQLWISQALLSATYWTWAVQADHPGERRTYRLNWRWGRSEPEGRLFSRSSNSLPLSYSVRLPCSFPVGELLGAPEQNFLLSAPRHVCLCQCSPLWWDILSNPSNSAAPLHLHLSRFIFFITLTLPFFPSPDL